MKFEKIALSEIKLAEYNPRKISDKDVQHLKNSIEEFGLVSPIIINLRNNRIIGGHQRYKILLEKNVKELSILKLGNIAWCFTEQDLKVKNETNEKALNIALNNIKGEWDEYKLNNILEELTLDGFDVTLTGFEAPEMPEEFVDLKNSDEDFFNNEVDLYDSIEDIANDEISVRSGNAHIKLGNFTIVINPTTLKRWMVTIEKDCNFETTEIIDEIEKRLGIWK